MQTRFDGDPVFVPGFDFVIDFEPGSFHDTSAWVFEIENDFQARPVISYQGPDLSWSRIEDNPVVAAKALNDNPLAPVSFDGLGQGDSVEHFRCRKQSFGNDVELVNGIAVQPCRNSHGGKHLRISVAFNAITKYAGLAGQITAGAKRQEKTNYN